MVTPGSGFFESSLSVRFYQSDFEITIAGGGDDSLTSAARRFSASSRGDEGMHGARVYMAFGCSAALWRSVGILP